MLAKCLKIVFFENEIFFEYKIIINFPNSISIFQIFKIYISLCIYVIDGYYINISDYFIYIFANPGTCIFNTKTFRVFISLFTELEKVL